MSLQKNNELSNFEIVLFHFNNVEEGIDKYNEQNNIDLITTGNHQRGSFSTLFRKSILQDIVKTLYYPITIICNKCC